MYWQKELVLDLHGASGIAILDGELMRNMRHSSVAEDSYYRGMYLHFGVIASAHI